MYKRFPQDYSREELVGLVNYHHNEHIKASISLSELKEKHILISKELSLLKRNKQP